MYESILVERRGHVALVTLNRPERLNAWSVRMDLEVRHALQTFDEDDDVRCIVLTGAGKAFCVGADLSEGGGRMPAGDRDAMAAELGVDHTRRYGDLRTPTIVAMNGTSAGVGMTLPMQLDLRIVAEDAKYAFVFNRRGMIPELGATWLLPRLIGTAKALELLLTGRIMSGAEAAACGFANEACPAERVLERSLEIADDIATNVAPLSAAVTKRLVFEHMSEPDPAAAEDLELRLLGWFTAQEDFREGVTAFFEKRTPQWSMGKNADFPEEFFADRGDARS